MKKSKVSIILGSLLLTFLVYLYHATDVSPQVTGLETQTTILNNVWDKANSALKTSTVGAGGGTEVSGTTADGAAASGNPVQVAGKDGSGNIQTFLTATNGKLETTDNSQNATALADGTTNTPTTNANSAGTALRYISYLHGMNDALTWERLRTGSGLTGTGILRVSPVTNDPCQSSAVNKSSVVIAITGNVELIPLSGSTVIYVCGYQVTAGGTVPSILFRYGTGTTCGTGQVNLTGQMVLPVANITYTPGMTAFKTAVGNALCVVAGGTTPTINGVLTYVQQ